MDMSLILEWVKSLAPVAGIILQVLGTLVVVASIVVKATQSQSDDEAFARVKALPIIGSLVVALERFSIIERKPE